MNGQKGPEYNTLLEERVAQLGISSNGPSTAIPGQSTSVKENKEGSRALTADSLVVLLTQAIQSNDKALLEECLQVRNETVILNTVKSLRSDQVGKLVPLLVERYATRFLAMCMRIYLC